MLLLSIIYGVHMIAIVYLITFLAVRGCMSSGVFPFYLVTAKYLIYWAMVSFGFAHLTASGIIGGLIGGVYLSLPIMVWVNRKVCEKYDLMNKSATN